METLKVPSVVDAPTRPLREGLIWSAFVFFVAYLSLFMGMSLRPNVYDESLILTGAMRVAEGQVIHRDFYANYGPGQFYILAGLFKLFGESLLVERLYDLFLKALIVTTIYTIVSSYGRKSIAVWTSVVAIAWLFSLHILTGTPLIPVSLLNLVASALILPAFSRSISRRRMLAAGLTGGIAALFRYDTGIALLGVHACVIAVAVSLRTSGVVNRLRAFVSVFWSYLLGFSAVTLSAVFYYLSVSPLYPFVYDIIIYQSKHYHGARDLPFPGISLINFDDIGIYLPIAILGISLYIVVAHRFRDRGKDAPRSQTMTEEQKWHGFLITFGLLAFVMYFKGFVRVSLLHMYLSMVPSLLLIAVLFQHRLTFSRSVRASITLLMWLFTLASGWSVLLEIVSLRVEHASVPRKISLTAKHALPQIQATWCRTENPLTRGFCFLPDDDHIQTIEFIDSHTRPDQKLFVGLTRHDRILENDNLTYFATQRLPATKWSHFDPGLQNSYDIQTQMVHELQVNAPPYIVLDSEFDQIREPNDSSKSSGVTLLDDYIHSKYQRIETYGELSIWQRMNAP